ncbi:DUF4224 domain-containing protein [Janthinobacterium sp. Mn2066]|uniref:DUF4224 domain-containing protein n=1 Tax=Janthinobacterium sp. Mn2066 TaxID=3395264 RepID=UPI003BC1138A
MTPIEIEVLARLAAAIEKMQQPAAAQAIDVSEISRLAVHEKVAMNELALSNQEIIDLTHYKRAAEQLRVLKAMGIPATRLHDNTVRVLRMHLMQPAATAPEPRPMRKSERKRLDAAKLSGT